MAIHLGQSHTVGNRSMAIGDGNTASGQNSIAVGSHSEASENETIAMGSSAYATGTFAFAMGYGSQASALSSIAMGYMARSKGYHSIAMGRYSYVTSDCYYSVAIGPYAKCGSDGSRSVAMVAGYASGYKSIAMGDSMIAEGEASICLGGRDSQTVSGADFSFASGHRATATRYAEAVRASGRFDGNSEGGQAQISTQIARAKTTDATLTTMDLGSASKRITIGTDMCVFFTVSLVAVKSDDAEEAAYKFEGVMHNDAGTTTLDGSLTKTVIHESDAAYDATVEADNTNNALVIKVTGKASHTIRWVAKCELVEVKSGT